MTSYGTETDIAYPTLDIKVESLGNFRADELKSSFRRITQHHKVHTTEDELTVLSNFTGLLQKLKRSGSLLYKHNDSTMLPAVTIKYPKNDDTSSWFIITTYTIIVL